MSRIGIIGENSIEYIDKLLDIWSTGNSAVLLDWRIPLGTACEMMFKSNVQKCFIEKSIYEKANIMTSGISFIVFESRNNTVEELSKDFYLKYQDNQSMNEAVVLFSSGTTGKAKGIILSHYAISKNADLISEYMCLNDKDSIYILKSLSHSSTLVGELLVGLRTSTRVIISPTVVSTSSSLKCIDIFRATIVCINPSLLNLLTKTAKIHNKGLNYLKKIYTSGAIADASLINEARDVFANIEVLNVYGLSEAGPRVAAQRSNTDVCGSVGFPINEVFVKIMCENGLESAPGEKGLIHVKTPCLFLGYVTDTLKRDTLCKDWLNTGDIGYTDTEGQLFVTGRSDNMIVVGSHNVYPEEIESYILSTKKIHDCIIVSQKNSVYSEKLVCFYVSDNNVSNDLHELCIKSLANYEVPHVFYRIKEIPRTVNNKNIRDLSVYQKYMENNDE